MKHALVIIPLFGLILAACDTRSSAPITEQTRQEALAECRDLGFSVDQPEMEKCINAGSRGERRVLVDMDTYGTF